MRQIRDRSDLPKEFSLEKYAPTAAFDIADWLVNLEARGLSTYMQGEHFRPDDQVTRCEIFLENPIRDRGDFENFPGRSKYIHTSSVRDFESIDLFWHGRADERYAKFMEGFDEFVDSNIPYLERAEMNLELIERMDTPFYKMMETCGVRHDGDVLAKVDLHSSDEKLAADFSAWVKATRLQTGIAAPRKKFTAVDFSNWSDSGILPYLDLTLWASANEIEITQQLLGTTIYPSEFNVNLAERIRKVTRPLAKLMTREVFTDALRGQAMAEIAERGSTEIIPEKHSSFVMPE
jgi:hypothetical protein